MKKDKKKKFIKKPEYPGGNKAFREFIQKNLIYPQEAIKNKIEGTVILQLTVDDNGNVIDVKLKHGIGYGCDEEATRLAKMLKYTPVKNIGLRVKITTQVKITFKLPIENKIHYTYKEIPKKKDTQNKKNETYNWKLNI